MSALYPAPNALYILLKTPSIPNPDTKSFTLIDSSSHLFIDPQFVAMHDLCMMPLNVKILLYLSDGSCNSVLDHFVNLEILLPTVRISRLLFM